MERGQARALAKGAAAAVSWGASFVAIKVALRTLSPLPLVWLRFGLGVGVLSLFVLREREKDHLSFREWLLVGLLGFLGVPLHHLVQSTGLKTAQAATSAWIISSMPVFIALLGALFLGERMGRRRIGNRIAEDRTVGKRAGRHEQLRARRDGQVARNRGDRLEIYTAGRLHQGTAGNQTDTVLHGRTIHIIEHNNISTSGKRLLDLLNRFGLDLNL